MSQTLTTGDVAPDVALVDEHGEAHALSTLVAAGPVLLVFFKVTCPTCQLTLPYLNRLQSGALRVIGVSQDTPELTARFRATYGVELDMLYDRDEDDYPASNAFAITHVPTLFVVEPGMRITYDLSGFAKTDLETLAERAGRALFTSDDAVPAWKAG